LQVRALPPERRNPRKQLHRASAMRSSNSTQRGLGLCGGGARRARSPICVGSEAGHAVVLSPRSVYPGRVEPAGSRGADLGVRAASQGCSSRRTGGWPAGMHELVARLLVTHVPPQGGCLETPDGEDNQSRGRCGGVTCPARSRSACRFSPPAGRAAKSVRRPRRWQLGRGRPVPGRQ
jgi:hypothetical protein